MKKTVLAMLLFISLPVFQSCDEGKIYPVGDEGEDKGLSSVVMKGEITGCGGFYGSDFSLVLGAFEEGNPFAMVTKTVTDGAEEVILSNIPSRAASVEVCVINRLRERVFTLASLSLPPAGTRATEFEVGSLDASPFHIIEENVFETSCSRCHGASGYAAAGLSLLPGIAYSMLADQPSAVLPGRIRVEPGNAPASVLWDALATNLSDSWAFSHSNLLTSEKTEFVESWINKGAEK